MLLVSGQALLIILAEVRVEILPIVTGLDNRTATTRQIINMIRSKPNAIR
jgi:hypothetical protein